MHKCTTWSFNSRLQRIDSLELSQQQAFNEIVCKLRQLIRHAHSQ